MSLLQLIPFSGSFHTTPVPFPIFLEPEFNYGIYVPQLSVIGAARAFFQKNSGIHNDAKLLYIQAGFRVAKMKKNALLVRK